MANSSLFRSLSRRAQRPTVEPAVETDAVNEAGAPAYAMTPQQALVQASVTGCFNDIFYSSAASQLDDLLELCLAVETDFVARTAVYARTHGFMKDVPAFLVAYLASVDVSLAERVFPVVIDNGRMLRNFVQFIRSGVVGRRSFGSAPKRWIRAWFDARSDEEIFRASIGNQPSLADIIRMVHPRPKTAARRALYGYLVDRPYDVGALCEPVRAFVAFKSGERTALPDVPFAFLTAFDLEAHHWRTIADGMSWQQTRMNLNTLARHGVFASEAHTRRIADRLRDPAKIRRARVFPYQLLAAYKNLAPEVPDAIRVALHDAVETSLQSVPVVAGGVIVAPDVSGSMLSPITGFRPGATSRVRCIDVAALVAAAFLRTQPNTTVLPFDYDVHRRVVRRRESVLANAEALASIGGGGTNVSAPLVHANERGLTAPLVVLVSDNESWVDARCTRGTALMDAWATYRHRVPHARLVCLDLVPNRTAQAYARDDILLVGGFSDRVFDVIANFAAGRGRAAFTEVVESVELPGGANEVAR